MKKIYFSTAAKIMAVVLAVTMVLPVGYKGSVFAEDAITYGDVNGDTSINASDALLALQYAAKLAELDENQLKIADVNGDEKTSARDALLILQYAAGIIDKFPVSSAPTTPPVVTETVEPTDTDEPIETVKPTDTEKPIETVEPTDTEKPTETAAPTETEEPTTAPGLTYGIINGDIVKSLELKDENYYKSWSIDDSLEVNDLVFGDRTVTFVDIDDSLIGSEYIVTSCDSKKTETDLAVLTAAEDMVLSIGFDARLKNIPSWVSDFTKSEVTCTGSNDVIFIIYQKEVKAGEIVTLGAQGTSVSVVGYIAIATPKSGSVETPAETVAPTEAPAGDSIPFSGTIYIASDSIADGYDNRPLPGSDVVGWGNIFANYLSSDVTVKNEANLGDSTKSYWYDLNGDGIGDGQRYKAIYQNITKDDYVIICFGHNDGPANRDDVPVGTSSDQKGSYQWYLKDKFIEPALAVGAQPILMTPVVRNFYKDGVFYEEDYHLKYGQAVRDLVEEYAKKGIVIPLIDAQQYTYDLYKTLSASEAAKYHATNDTTHYNQAGCERICEYITSQLKTYNLGINQYIK